MSACIYVCCVIVFGCIVSEKRRRVEKRVEGTLGWIMAGLGETEYSRCGWRRKNKGIVSLEGQLTGGQVWVAQSRMRQSSEEEEI